MGRRAGSRPRWRLCSSSTLARASLRISYPALWASTANFNERLAFIVKDATIVIDDFRPGIAERRRLEGEADRLLRAAGRGRLKSDTSLRLDHPPRALILSTGKSDRRGRA